MTSLREIAAGKVHVGTDDTDNYLLENEAASAPEGEHEQAEEDALKDEQGDQAAISEEK